MYLPVNVENLKKIIENWASKLPYKVNIYMFGSRMKGTSKRDSDLDIAIEFLDENDAWLLWFALYEKWQKDLSCQIGVKVDLQLYEGDESEHLQLYLNEASMLLYSSG